MATLTNTKIKDTYDGLLKTTDNEALDVSGTTLIEDGLGNASALSVGRVGNGVTVNGLLDVTGEVQGTSLDINGAADISGSLNATLATAAQPNITSVGTLSSLAVSGNLAVDTNTLYVDASSNEVGIGTSSPSYQLQVQNSTNAILALTAGTADNQYAQILFGDSANAAQGRIRYENFTDSMEFIANSTSAMLIDSSGNVGIGKSPSAKLDVSNELNANAVGSAILEVRNTRTNTGSGAANIRFITNEVQVGTQDNRAQIGAEYDGSNGGRLIFSTAQTSTKAITERMRIDSSGNVGIGIAPSSKLGIFSSGGYSVFSSGKSVNGIDIQGTAGGSGNYASGISFGVGGLGRAAISAVQNSADSDVVGLAFFTHGSSTGSADAAERMRITSTGELHHNSGAVYLGSGGATPNGTSVYGTAFVQESGSRRVLYMAGSSTAQLSVARFFNPNGQVGEIKTDNSSTLYITSSDYRLKENVVEMTGALDRVDALKPSRFNFIADPEKTVDGFLAHEVQAIVPEAVTGEKDAVDEEGNPVYQGIDQSKIVPLLVGAIQELKAEIELLKSQING